MQEFSHFHPGTALIDVHYRWVKPFPWFEAVRHVSSIRLCRTNYPRQSRESVIIKYWNKSTNPRVKFWNACAATGWRPWSQSSLARYNQLTVLPSRFSALISRGICQCTILESVHNRSIWTGHFPTACQTSFSNKVPSAMLRLLHLTGPRTVSFLNTSGLTYCSMGWNLTPPRSGSIYGIEKGR